MRKMLRLIIMILLLSVPAMAVDIYEENLKDTTLYTETDTGNKLRVFPSIVYVDSLPRTVDAWVMADKGAGFFDSETRVTHTFSVVINATPTDGGCVVVYMWSNTPNVSWTSLIGGGAGKDGVAVLFRRNGTYNEILLAIVEDGVLTEASPVISGYSLTTSGTTYEYFCSLEYDPTDTGMFSLTVATGSWKPDNGTIFGVTSQVRTAGHKVSFRYFYPVNCYRAIGDGIISGEIQQHKLGVPDNSGTYTLTVTATDGTVIKDPNRAVYRSGEVVQLVPRPADRKCFHYWSGNIAAGVANLDVATIVMNSNKSLECHFRDYVNPLGIPYPSWGMSDQVNRWKFAGPASITTFSNAGGGLIRADATAARVGNNDPNYYFYTGQSIKINGTTDYDGTYSITKVSNSAFTFSHKWSTDQGGGDANCVDARALKDATTGDYYKYNFYNDGASGNNWTFYRMGPYGPYTHYILQQHGSNTGRLFGTKQYPRSSVPNSTLYYYPGSIVDIHETGNGVGGQWIISGTEDRPMLWCGDGTTVVQGGAFYDGNYYLMENLVYDMQNTARRAALAHSGYRESDTSHLAWRNCTFKRTLASSGTGTQVFQFSVNPTTYPNSWVHDILIYNCKFYDCGQDRPTHWSRDLVAIAPLTRSSNVWVIDCYSTRIGGDLVQGACDRALASQDVPHHIYIGRCIATNSFENHTDFKNVRHAIVSDCTAYNFGPSFARSTIDTTGAGCAFRCGTTDIGVVDGGRHHVWFLRDRMFNIDVPASSGAGIRFENDPNRFINPVGDEEYAICNLIYNVKGSQGVYAGHTYGLTTYLQDHSYLLNNTLYGTDTAIWIRTNLPLSQQKDKAHPQPANPAPVVANNIFGPLNSGSLYRYHIEIDGLSTDDLTNMNITNNVYYDPSSDRNVRRGIWNGITYARDMSCTTLSSWFSLHPTENKLWNVNDPKWVDASGGDFHTASNGSGVDQGSNLLLTACSTFKDLYGIDIWFDLANTVWASPIDIGAYQYDTGGGGPPTGNGQWIMIRSGQ